MIFRPASAEDLDAVLAVRAGRGVQPPSLVRLGEDFATGRMRPEWAWIAQDIDGSIVGRALWWGRETSHRPLTLDVLGRVSHRLGEARDRVVV